MIANSKRFDLRSALAVICATGMLVFVACGTNDFNPDAGWSGVIDGGDVVYVGTMDRQIIALDSNTGALKAAFPKEPDGDREAFGAIYGTPTLAGERVYVAGFNGKVYALSAQDLEPVFTGAVFELGSAALSKGIVGSVIEDRGILIFGAAEDSESGRLYVLRAETLGEICRFPAANKDPIGKVWSTPAIANGVAYFGDMAHHFYAVRIEDCSLLWAAPVKLNGAIAATPLVRNGTVYIGSFDRNFYAIDTETGTMRHLFKAGSWFWSGVATNGEMLFIPNMDGKLYALNLATESVEWEFDTDGAILASPTLVGDQVVIASDSEQLYVVDTRTGLESWSRQLTGKVRAPLTSRGSVVYLSTLDHKVEAIDVAVGRAHWTEPASTKR